jgi:hypothetical protein
MKQRAGIGPAGEARFDYAVYDANRAGFEHAEDVAAVRRRIAGLVDAGRYPSPLWA